VFLLASHLDGSVAVVVYTTLPFPALVGDPYMGHKTNEASPQSGSDQETARDSR